MKQQQLQFLVAILFVFAINRSNQYITAGDGQYPYVVSFHEMGSHKCAGVILDEYHILIPGWCNTGNFIKGIHAGTNERANNNPTRVDGTKYGIEEIFVHRDYSSTTENNIAIARLLRPLQFSNKIQPIQISSAFLIGQEDVTVAGWFNDASINMEYEMERTINTPECQNMVDDVMILSEQVICTLTPEPGFEQKGFGSGLMLNDKLVGMLVEYQGAVNIYTRLASHTSWIKSIVYDLCTC